jgi:hypothetical protein
MISLPSNCHLQACAWQLYRGGFPRFHGQLSPWHEMFEANYQMESSQWCTAQNFKFTTTNKSLGQSTTITFVFLTVFSCCCANEFVLWETSQWLWLEPITLVFKTVFSCVVAFWKMKFGSVSKLDSRIGAAWWCWKYSEHRQFQYPFPFIDYTNKWSSNGLDKKLTGKASLKFQGASIQVCQFKPSFADWPWAFQRPNQIGKHYSIRMTSAYYSLKSVHKFRWCYKQQKCCDFSSASQQIVAKRVSNRWQ